MTNTTAFYRSEAAAEAKVCNWYKAALLFEEAIKVYPVNSLSALSKADKKSLKEKADACWVMFKQEKAAA